MSATEIVRELSRHGLLFQKDKRYPSVVGIVTGEALSTSWWGHPKARLVFAILQELADDPDVLFTKLLFGKVTLVHRRLWPALLAIGTSAAAWQLRNLPPSAHRLLVSLQETPKVEGDGEPAKELEKRLLANASEVHTRTGRHSLTLESWRRWATRVSVSPMDSLPEARKLLEEATEALGAPLTALPWVAAERALKNSR